MAMKKLSYSVTVYRNTGFNGLDIPKSGAVLENAPHTTYTDVYYLREDLDLPQIRINDNYHNLADVDYVKLVSNDITSGAPTTFYYFAVPKADAGNTTTFSLELDALTTMGGAANLDYISGWQERGHIAKADDVLFGNVASEDWTPSQPLESSVHQKIAINNTSYSGNDLELVTSTTNIDDMGQHADEINVIEGQVNIGVTDTVMYIPKIISNVTGTSFVIEPEEPSANPTQYYGEIPHVIAFNVNNSDVQAGLNKLFSCGQLQLENSYILPKEYIKDTDITGNADSYATRIIGHCQQAAESNFPFEYTPTGYTVKNKKCYSTFRSVTIYNPASGASLTKNVAELKYAQNGAPVIRIWADPLPTGKPYAKFVSDVSPNLPYIDFIEGGTWICSQIVLEGASGSLWNSINAAFAQQNLDREKQLADFSYQISNSQNIRNIGGMQMQANVNESLAKLNLWNTPGGILTKPTPSSIGSGLTSLYTQQKNLEVMQAMNDINLQNATENARMNAQQYIANTNRIAQEINENRVGLLKNNNIVAPTALFTPSPSLSMYKLNNFYIYETRKSLQDLQSEDMYYQRYGYNGLHKPLTAACFNCRTYYTFVQAFDVNIKAPSVSFGMRIRNKAISQLNSGVRVWSVLPDPQYYETN